MLLFFVRTLYMSARLCVCMCVYVYMCVCVCMYVKQRLSADNGRNTLSRMFSKPQIKAGTFQEQYFPFCFSLLFRPVLKIAIGNVRFATEQLGSSWTDFNEIWAFCEYLSTEIEYYWNLTRITGNLRTDLCTFMIIYRSIILRMRNASEKNRRKNYITYFI